MTKQGEPQKEEGFKDLINVITQQTESNKALIDTLTKQAEQQKPFDMDEFFKKFADTIATLQKPPFDMDEFFKKFADTIATLQKPPFDVDEFSKKFASHIAGLQSNIQKEYSNITQTTIQQQRTELKNKLSWGLVNSIRIQDK